MNTQSTIQFDLASVPREICDDLARPLALAVDAYFKQPGVEEKFQQWLVEYNKRKAEKQVYSAEIAQRTFERNIKRRGERAAAN